MPPESLIGTTIDGNFQILSQIGKGGMGAVYEARQVLINRTVAIKTLLPHLMEDPRAAQRFQQEARAVSSLSHHHIVSIHHFGITPDGIAYLVMDYLDGKSLSETIRQCGFLEAERAVSIFIQIASGLGHAHSKGIIHRDLKAGNVILLDRDNPDFVKIMDFGIAKVLTWEGEKGATLTNTGDILGSPQAMSPEQCRGEKLDFRSDIYSMGCLMYETLTGESPFEGENPLETLYRQINEPPKSMKEANPNANVPVELETIVLRCLAKDPSQRFQKAEDLEAALARLKPNKRPGVFTVLHNLLQKSRTHLTPATRREKTVLAASMVICTVALAYVAFGLREQEKPGANPAPPNSSVKAPAEQKKPSGEASTGAPTGQRPRTYWSDPRPKIYPPLTIPEETQLEAGRILLENIRHRGRPAGSTTEDGRRMFNELMRHGAVAARHGQWRAALSFFSIADRTNDLYHLPEPKSILGQRPMLSLRNAAERGMAECFYQLGDYHRAAAYFNGPLNQLLARFGDYNPEDKPHHDEYQKLCSSVRIHSADSNYMLGRSSQAFIQYQNLISTDKYSRLPEDPVDLALLYSRYGDCCLQVGAYPEAKDNFLKALPIWLKLKNIDNLAICRDHLARARCFCALGLNEKGDDQGARLEYATADKEFLEAATAFKAAGRTKPEMAARKEYLKLRAWMERWGGRGAEQPFEPPISEDGTP